MHYRPAPGLEIARLGDDDRFLLRSDFVALELSGDTAAILVEQVLERMDRPLTAAEIGLGAAPTLARLANATVAVMGLEAHGAHVARLLADAGVGRLVLADPFPFEPAHRQ